MCRWSVGGRESKDTYLISYLMRESLCSYLLISEYHSESSITMSQPGQPHKQSNCSSVN